MGAALTLAGIVLCHLQQQKWMADRAAKKMERSQTTPVSSTHQK
jgi:hypothetical protein